MTRSFICCSFLALAWLAGGALAPAHAEKGDWLLRTRALLVAPTERSSDVLPLFPGTSISVENAMTGEVDVTYFFHRNFGVEAVFGYPSHHSMSAEGNLGFLGEVVGTDALASIAVVQFHPFPDARIRPYVGIGANWTNFLYEHESNSLLNALGPTEVTIDDSFGYVAQAGFDIAVTERAFVNFDVKYVDIDTVATIDSSGLINTVDLALDPVVFGVGFGARF